MILFKEDGYPYTHVGTHWIKSGKSKVLNSLCYEAQFVQSLKGWKTKGVVSHDDLVLDCPKCIDHLNNNTEASWENSDTVKPFTNN